MATKQTHILTKMKKHVKKPVDATQAKRTATIVRTLRGIRK